MKQFFLDYPWMIIIPLGVFMIVIRWLEREPLETGALLLGVAIGFGMTTIAWGVVHLAMLWQQAYLKGQR